MSTKQSKKKKNFIKVDTADNEDKWKRYSGTWRGNAYLARRLLTCPLTILAAIRLQASSMASIVGVLIYVGYDTYQLAKKSTDTICAGKSAAVTSILSPRCHSTEDKALLQQWNINIWVIFDVLVYR